MRQSVQRVVMRRTCAEHGKAEVCIASDARFWDAPDRWMIWATGKTILGAQLGGYAGVEVVKRVTGYTRATGD